MTKEEVLGSATLLSILPVLSLSTVEALASDLERAAQEFEKKHDENGLWQIVLAIHSYRCEVKSRQDQLDAELMIDART